RSAREVVRGGQLRDADAGVARCGSGELLVAQADELETASLLDIESACRVERPAPEEIPLLRRAPFTLAVAVVTAVVSTLVFVALGRDSISLFAAGGLSERLIVAEHQWWRLGTTMLLHGGWVHLSMNLVTIVLVGLQFETRAGPARTAIVYVGSG